MTLTPDDVKKIEKIGDSDKGDVLHVLTKGGMNLIVQKTKGGALNILGQGAHRAFAIHQASQIHKNIQWSDSLNKSEDMQKAFKFPIEILEKQEAKDAMGNPMYESTPQNHYDLAAHHSKMAGKAREMERAHKALKPNEWSADLHDHKMRQLMHSDVALKHYEMSGLSGADAKKEHEKHMDLHHELKDEKPPFNEYALQLAWQRANPAKRAPRGLGNWSE